MKKRTMLIMLLCVVGVYSWAANLPPNEDPKDDPKKDDCCPKIDPDCNGCLNYQYEFGRAANEPQMPTGRFSIFSQRPSQNLFSPINLYYFHPLFMQILKDENSGNQRKVEIMGENREAEVYVFQNGESIGYPGLTFRNKLNTTLVMLDANEIPTTETPIYYRLQKNDGSSILFSVSTRKAISFTTASGHVLTSTSKDLRLEIIYNNDGSIQQVYSGVDGLAEVVIISQEHGYILGYETRIYAPNQIGEKNEKGLYSYSGTPHTVYRVQNPNRPQVTSGEYIDPDSGEAVETITVSPPDVREAIITRTFGNIDRITKYTYSDVVDDWIMDSGDGMKIIVREKFWNNSKTECMETMQVKDTQGVISYQETTLSKNFPFGNMIVEKTIGSENNPIKTWYTYYTDSSKTGSYGKLASERHSNGQWKKYFYDNQERISIIVSPFKDQNFSTPNEQAKIEYYIYSPVEPKDQPFPNDPRPRVKEIQIGGITVSKEYFAWYIDDNGEHVEVYEQCQLTTAEYGNASNARTVKRYYSNSDNSANAGRLKTIEFPNRKIDTYTYSWGNFTYANVPGESSFIVNDEGLSLRTTIIHGTIDFPDGIAYKSTKEEKITDNYGNAVLKRDYIYTGSTYEEVSWQGAKYNYAHQELSSENSRGEKTITEWNCCKKESFKNHIGIQHTYIYDDLQRLIQETRVGDNEQSDLITSYTYDSNNKVILKVISSDNMSSKESFVYDQAGRLIQFCDTMGKAVTYQYTASENNNAGEVITITYPGNRKKIISSFLDGSSKSLTGNAVVNEFVDKGVNADGSQWTKTHFGVVNSNRWLKETTDLSGKKVCSEKSAFGGTKITYYSYNNLQQLSKITRTALADIIYNYDDWGNICLIGEDLNQTGIIDKDSDDKIIEIERNVAQEAGAWWYIEKKYTYGSKDNANATLLKTTKKRLSGFLNGNIFENIDLYADGNTVIEKHIINPDEKKLTIEIQKPGSNISAQTIWVNERKILTRNEFDITQQYEYNGLGWLTGIIDSRTGKTTLEFYTIPEKFGLTKSQTDPAGNITSYDYDEITGQMIWEKNPLGKYKRYAYNSLGKIVKIWGDATYPIQMHYDSWGQQTDLWTYRTINSGKQENWSGNTDIADHSSWNYDIASGLVSSKTDATGKTTYFTYDVNDNLVQKRYGDNNITDSSQTINYRYYPSSGLLQTIDYSDATPDITFSYNRLGQIDSVIDIVGQRNFIYDQFFKYIGESISGKYSKTFSREYVSSGNRNNIHKVYLDENLLYNYEYDARGRMTKINDNIYTYMPNSNLVHSVLRPNGISSAFLYEEKRNLVTQISNGNISTFNYINNPIGQRVSITKDGEAMTILDHLSITYNSRNEVINATSDNDLSYKYTFSYDDIGNRTTYTQEENTTSYISNSNNQYIAINDELISYDILGNALSIAGWQLKWNIANQLIEASNGNTKLCFSYDYLERRIEKKVYSDSVLQKHILYVYDGFNLVEELDALDENKVIRRYTWQSAFIGPVVPLTVSDISSNAIFYYTTDANKNISEILDSNGHVVAHYEYDPYGYIKKSIGTYANDNPIRFSSEYYDSETNLIYYTFRYYAPLWGRWLSRDPMGEKGGINLYAMVENSPFSKFDKLGLSSAGWCQLFPPSYGQELLAHHYKAEYDKQNSANSDRSFGDYWNAPANWAMTGEWFPTDEQLGNAYNDLANSLSPSGDRSLNISFPFSTFSIKNVGNGCFQLCVAISTTLGGAGVSENQTKGAGPGSCVSWNVNLLKIIDVSQNIGSGATDTGSGFGLSSPVGFDISIACVKLNDKGEDHCPCPETNQDSSTFAGALWN